MSSLRKSAFLALALVLAFAGLALATLPSRADAGTGKAAAPPSDPNGDLPPMPTFWTNCIHGELVGGNEVALPLVALQNLMLEVTLKDAEGKLVGTRTVSNDSSFHFGPIDNLITPLYGEALPAGRYTVNVKPLDKSIVITPNEVTVTISGDNARTWPAVALPVPAPTPAYLAKQCALVRFKIELPGYIRFLKLDPDVPISNPPPPPPSGGAVTNPSSIVTTTVPTVAECRQGIPLAGWQFEIAQGDASNIAAGPIVPFQPACVTGANGMCTTAALTPGLYWVRETPQTGWRQVYPVPPTVWSGLARQWPITVAAASTMMPDVSPAYAGAPVPGTDRVLAPIGGQGSVSGRLFCNTQVPPPCIDGYKINDQDVGIQGWTITATQGGSSVVGQTNSNGYFRLEGLSVGDWLVTEEEREGWTPVTAPEMTVTVQAENVPVNECVHIRFKNRPDYGVLDVFKRNTLFVLQNQPPATIWTVPLTSGIAGWDITVYPRDGGVPITQQTDGQGWTRFFLTPNQYYDVCETEIQTRWIPWAVPLWPAAVPLVKDFPVNRWCFPNVYVPSMGARPSGTPTNSSPPTPVNPAVQPVITFWNCQAGSECKCGRPALATATGGATTSPATPAPGKCRVLYTVRAGDSLSKLAARYGTTVSAIQRRNSMNSSLIRTGQKLCIP